MNTTSLVKAAAVSALALAAFLVAPAAASADTVPGATPTSAATTPAPGVSANGTVTWGG
ncbi:MULTISPECIES: hypothetical protein [Kitasatospora]|uniref:Uncharacterized protein n=1 Tax=Kitasatospora setae (strain ATCC 33774 / DSM 43861 / JCM 3304 / KCC A-0304 / NBRC 14216 / KM-6054) TaxID=452652 RepID=E4NDN3_KITSK|nr:MULTISPECIES: hypothetical protein [Kitasatospora]BAJ29314.1 hypothetical protein KSE_35070 [Kitasatospora setae KM-6054]